MFVYSVLSVFWLSGLRGGCSCGGGHGLASRLGGLGCSLLAFCFNFVVQQYTLL